MPPLMKYLCRAAALAFFLSLGVTPCADAAEPGLSADRARPPLDAWSGRSEPAPATDPPRESTGRPPIRFEPSRRQVDTGAMRASASGPSDEPPAKLTPQSEEKSMPLAPPTKADGAARATSDLPKLATLLGSLGMVLGLFFFVAWVLRHGMPKSSTQLPREVVEVLGRATLVGRQHVHLVRCGNKMLLVAISPGCMETLTEITDPVEVDRLAGLCAQSHPHSATASFRHVFQQFNRAPERGYRSKREKPDFSAVASLAAHNAREAADA